MEITKPDNREKLYSFFRNDIYRHYYEIGDLEEPFWNDSVFFAAEENGRIESSFLVYGYEQVKTFIARGCENISASFKLMRNIIPELPGSLYCHAEEGLREEMSKYFDTEFKGSYLNMKAVKEPDYDEFIKYHDWTVKPGIDDFQRLKKFIKDNNPDAWFDMKMLSTGKYLMIEHYDEIVAVAGVHVYSEKYSIAVLGNVVTAKKYRNRGYSTSVTASLLKELKGCGIKDICLNVKEGNESAIKVYEKLGFEINSSHEEFTAIRKNVMAEKKRMSALNRFRIFLAVAVLMLVSLSIIAGLTEKSLEYREQDLDGDGIENIWDNDVDGDGIINVWDEDADNDGIPNTEDALIAARKLIGRPYEQLMGGHNNIGWKLGGIVCIDVINLSFEQAGIYFEKELRDCYKKNRYIFTHRQWNNRWDRNFARRVMNFRAYCREKGYLLKDGARLQPGDIVMFGTGHIALIEKVEGDDFTTIEASGKKILTMRTSKEDIYRRSLERYGDVVFARMTYKKKR